MQHWQHTPIWLLQTVTNLKMKWYLWILCLQRNTHTHTPQACGIISELIIDDNSEPLRYKMLRVKPEQSLVLSEQHSSAKFSSGGLHLKFKVFFKGLENLQVKYIERVKKTWSKN